MEIRQPKERRRFRDRLSKVMSRKRSEGVMSKYASSIVVDSPLAETKGDSQLPQVLVDADFSRDLSTAVLSSLSTIQYPKASFLGIPGELRNQIYRYILLEDQLVKLTPQDHELPGILRTCRQIQDEATDIYKNENNFQVDAWNMQLGIPSNYADHWMSTLEHSHFWITMRGPPQWDNFMVWLKRYSTGEVPGLASGQPTDEAEILAQAFEIVHGMKKLLQFDQIQPVLDAWKKSVVLAGANFVFP